MTLNISSTNRHQLHRVTGSEEHVIKYQDEFVSYCLLVSNEQ